MPRLSDWFRKGTERLTEVLLGSDLQSRMCAYIDLMCTQRSDGILPTRFRIEVDQTLFDQKMEEYRRQTGSRTDKDDLEKELALAARDHILGKGRAYKTYADTVTVRLEPHVMTRGVKIIAEFPQEKKLPTSLSVSAKARNETPEDAKLPTVARPVSTTFDSRSLETIVHAERRPPALETRVFDPSEKRLPDAERRVVQPPTPRPIDKATKDKPPADPMKTTVYQPPGKDSAKRRGPMETRVYQPGEDARKSAHVPLEGDRAEDDSQPMETHVYQSPQETEGDTGDEMATVVEEPTRATSILYRLVLLEPEEGDEYTETESWMLETDREYVVGRSSTCDIVLPIPTISRRHVKVQVVRDGTILISDAGSSHGTFVNGSRVERATPVEVGDDIQLTQRGAAHLAVRPLDG